MDKELHSQIDQRLRDEFRRRLLSYSQTNQRSDFGRDHLADIVDWARQVALAAIEEYDTIKNMQSNH
jgi:hypothetical protein